MQFRCVAAIALWTMLTGPIFGPPVDSSPSRHRAPVATAPAPEPVTDDAPAP
jgi:hypothetical protein